jgi:hypothetical protein
LLRLHTLNIQATRDAIHKLYLAFFPDTPVQEFPLAPGAWSRRLRVVVDTFDLRRHVTQDQLKDLRQRLWSTWQVRFRAAEWYSSGRPFEPVPDDLHGYIAQSFPSAIFSPNLSEWSAAAWTVALFYAMEQRDAADEYYVPYWVAAPALQKLGFAARELRQTFADRARTEDRAAFEGMPFFPAARKPSMLVIVQSNLDWPPAKEISALVTWPHSLTDQILRALPDIEFVLLEYVPSDARGSWLYAYGGTGALHEFIGAKKVGYFSREVLKHPVQLDVPLAMKPRDLDDAYMQAFQSPSSAK